MTRSLRSERRVPTRGHLAGGGESDATFWNRILGRCAGSSWGALGSAGILPAVSRASRPRRGGRGRPPERRRGGGASLFRTASFHATDIPLRAAVYFRPATP